MPKKAISLIKEDVMRSLSKKVRDLEKEVLSAQMIREKILGISSKKPSLPKWLRDKPKVAGCPGVPTLVFADPHCGEVVDPKCVGGLNKYNMTIFKKRLHTMVNKTSDLLHRHLRGGEKYPGLVFPLAGDIVSGDIHDELVQTNETPTIKCLITVYEEMILCIKELKRSFGSIFIPCVVGNHSRSTKKKQHKNRSYTNYEYLLYVLLEKYFENDPNITFYVPEGIDAYYSVYGHRYLLMHGDELPYGDAIIGAVGPIIRGDLRFRARAASIMRPYTTMILAHFHQYIPLQNVMVCPSLIGMNEYGYNRGFKYEPPRQACWITHIDHGITFQFAVNVEESVVKHQQETAWFKILE